MSLIKELKKILKSNPDNIDMIRYVVFEYINYFYIEYIHDKKIKSFYTPREFYSIKGLLSNVFDKTSKKELLLPGEIYEKIIPLKLKKKYGQVYTPGTTIESMVDEIVDEYDFIKNPKIKYLDPACGSGYFLIALYKKLKTIYNENEEYFLRNNNIQAEDIDRHIIENNIMGYDIDGFSCLLTTVGLNIAGKKMCCPDVRNEDYLFSELGEKVQFIIGNPPYIGHKNLELEYKKDLNNKYFVYKDKSDISYCFFEKGFDDLNNSGKLIFITSRYFLEADNADVLRKYINSNYGISRIVDYSGITLFKNTGVSPVIISLVKSMAVKKIEITNIANNTSFQVNGKDLDEKPWRLIAGDIEKIYTKIMSRTDDIIRDHFKINQGIITGLDKAFVVNRDMIEEYKLEEELLVSWIKGSALRQYEIKDKKGLKLIYTNNIEIKDYPNTMKYLEHFKERLEKRRECQRGYRRWFDLQWGRDRNQFEREKILFPYKSTENRFSVDKDKNYFSADIYMMTGMSSHIDLKESLGYLNSEIFEFLVKITSKKIGKNLYEYYPYNMLKLPYIHVSDFEGKEYENFHSMDLQLYDYFDFDRKDKQLIRNFIGKTI